MKYDDTGLTAQTLNDHYAAVSSDAGYQSTQLKQTAAPPHSFTTEETVFDVLDSLRPTATGLDRIPAWFLRLGAPIFSGPIGRTIGPSVAVLFQTSGNLPIYHQYLKYPILLNLPTSDPSP